MEAVAPERLLKLYMLLENEAAGVVSENPPRFIMAILFWYCARPYLTRNVSNRIGRSAEKEGRGGTC